QKTQWLRVPAKPKHRSHLNLLEKGPESTVPGYLVLTARSRPAARPYGHRPTPEVGFGELGGHLRQPAVHLHRVEIAQRYGCEPFRHRVCQPRPIDSPPIHEPAHAAGRRRILESTAAGTP